MFEVARPERHGGGSTTAAPGVGDVWAFASSLAAGVGEVDDAVRIELIRALEVLKCAAEGAQVAVTAAFDASQRQRAARRGEPEARQGRGIAHQVALARRESPHRAQRHVGLARILTTEMPCTLSALRGGHITEWAAMLLARETACLSLAERRRIDVELAADPEAIEQMGVRELVAKARKRAAELDPASVVARRSRAEADRCVTIRPAPDTMTWLTGHLPVREGVAVYAALRAEADRLIGTGDGRHRGQIMADTLVARVLGGREASSAEPTHVPLTVNVVISVESLLGSNEDAAEVCGYGPIPATTVREWIYHGLAAGAAVDLRRLFADPGTGQLVSMESRARCFPRGLADFIELRDQSCRTPWCDAPVRHADHVTAHGSGGPTSARNGQGLCQACNHAKQAVGWEAHPRPGPAHEVETTTPTGHRYRSRAPSLTRPTRPQVDLFWAA